MVRRPASRVRGIARALSLAGALAACTCLCACGPITYVNEVTRKASTDVDEARSAQADELAPYWFTLAVEYLQKAREEAAQADFQSANRFGRRASDAARKAIAASMARSRAGASGADTRGAGTPSADDPLGRARGTSP